LSNILEILERRVGCSSFGGAKLPDLNFPGNILIVESSRSFYSFRNSDIVDEDTSNGLNVRVWVKNRAQAWCSNRVTIGDSTPLRAPLVNREASREPPSFYVPGIPWGARDGDRKTLGALPPPLRTIAAAAAAYTGRCVGGDHYDNNCAHFLSDAFIRAG